MPAAPSITTDSDIRNTSPDIDLRHLTDGVSIAGGTTKRKFAFTASNILLTGQQNINATFPNVASMTLVGEATTQSLTNKTYIDALTTSSATTTVPIITRGLASQTANLQEWQNSSSTVLAKINSSGKIFAYNRITSPDSSFTNTERFGEGATVLGNNALAVGYNTSARTSSIVIGNNISLGASTNNTANTTVIGKDYTLPTSYYKATIVGINNTLTDFSDLVLIGHSNIVNNNYPGGHPSARAVIIGSDNNYSSQNEAVMVGNAISRTDTGFARCVGLGFNVSLKDGSVGVGHNLTVGASSLVIGSDTNVAANSVSMGRVYMAHTNCAFLGTTGRATSMSTTSNQCIFGQYTGVASAGYSQFYFGAGAQEDEMGRRDAAGVAVPGSDPSISFTGVSLFTTSARGDLYPNVQGLDMHMKPGYGSGLSKSGDFTIQVAGPAGVVSGVTMNSTYIERARFKSDGSTIFKPAGPSYIPLAIMGAASQTADLQQWQNSSSTVLAKVTSAGIFQPSGYKTATGVSGAANTTGGLTFEDGLYTGGTASGGSGLTWSGTASSITLVVSNGYITTSGGAVTLTLPVGALGNSIRVAGHGAGGWVIDLVTHTQTVTYGSSTGTASLSSTNQNDCVELLCISSTEWKVISGVGNVTLV